MLPLDIYIMCCLRDSPKSDLVYPRAARRPARHLIRMFRLAITAKHTTIAGVECRLSGRAERVEAFNPRNRLQLGSMIMLIDVAFPWPIFENIRKIERDR